MSENHLDSIESAIYDLILGKVIIVVDVEDRDAGRCHLR